MPVTQVADIIRVTWSFSLSIAGVHTEIADFGICFQSNSLPVTDADWNACLEEFATLAYDRWEANVAQSSYHTSIALDHVTVAHESTSGHVLHEQVYAINEDDSWVGSSSTGSLPWQTSMVVSLYAYARGTFVANARNKRGRIYLPPFTTTSLSNSDSGLMTDSYAQARRDEIGQMLTDINNHTWTHTAAFHPFPGVNSRGPFKDPAKGPHFYAITELSCDNKLDTQRRRVNQLPATISSTDWPS